MFGFIPNNIELYKVALIHRSESVHFEDREINNERLEFLGDAVIESVTSEYLFIEFNSASEGDLTKLRSRIVSRQSLNDIALKLGFDRYLISSTSANTAYKHIYGDAFEAMIGAMYLDQGYNFTDRVLINRIFREFISLEELLSQDNDYKSRLIEWCQKQHLKLVFRTKELPHKEGESQQFSSVVVINNIISGHGYGSSKKEAEQHAAESMSVELSDEQCSNLMDAMDRKLKTLK
ncbi:MAG: ribonuclease III [Alistipes sp.]|nr:ribonuclease III [Candidatus Alistipes equi]